MKVAEPGKARPAALGLRVHSGWAALVAIAIPLNRSRASGALFSCVPTILSRGRLSLSNSGTTVQPYHAAQSAVLEAAGAAGLTHRGAKQMAVQRAGHTVNLAHAEELIQRASDEARGLAKAGLKALLSDLRQQEYGVRACGILAGSGRTPGTLAATLASHTAIHTAEGELFRNALARAAEECGLTVVRIPERTLLAQASTRLSLPVEDLQKRVNGLGKALGSPWRQDQKLASIVAWIALADSPRHTQK